jgi:hydrogenase nickel incorporation protein HypB
MVVQTRLFTCGLSISHVERRPAASPQRAARVRENVGNLVCPALFDLGERARVVMLSVTEGDDKPLKHPHMFRAAEVVVITNQTYCPMSISALAAGSPMCGR